MLCADGVCQNGFHACCSFRRQPGFLASPQRETWVVTPVLADLGGQLPQVRLVDLETL